MESGIYVWKLDGVPKYVGQGIDVEKRMFQKHYECTVLIKAIKKYGYDSFEKEIICYCEPEELSNLEIYYIKELHTHVSEGGYNVSWGGEFSMLGLKHSEETKEKMSKSRLGEKNPRFGIHLSEETKQKISEANSGRILSEETKQKISKNNARANLGKHQSEETRQKLSIAPHLSGKDHPLFGKHRSGETKRKISESLSGENNPWFGKHLPEETRKKISDGRLGENNPMFGKKKKRTSSKYYGVYKELAKGKYLYWKVFISVNGIVIYLGKFETEIEAAKEYDKYVIENNLNRPLNFPEDYK